MPNSQRRRKKLLRAFPDVKLPFSLPVTHIFWNLYDNKAKAMNKNQPLASVKTLQSLFWKFHQPGYTFIPSIPARDITEDSWRFASQIYVETRRRKFFWALEHRGLPAVYTSTYFWMFFFFSTFLINCKLQQKSWKFLICFLAEERQIFPWGVTSPDNKPAPAWVSHSVTASFGHTPFPTRSSPGAARGSLLPCAPPWAAGRQLLHCGHTHGLQGNHRSSTCPSYTALGASRAAPLAYPHSSLCCCSAEVFFPILK